MASKPTDAVNPPEAAELVTPPKTLYHGSCHCKAITYTANLVLDPAKLVFTRCNCSVCLKSGFTGIQFPEADFTLVTPSSYSELPDYQWRSPGTHRYYCSKCGIQVFGKGYYEIGGNRVDFFSLNVLTLDPTDGLDLTAFKIKYFDGKNDNWLAGLQDKPWAGGCI